MKVILCYGDSNTWGYDPVTQDRFPVEERWPGVLAQELGAGYRVVEEGLGGRTTVWDDPIEGYKNGREYLIPCLETHKPIDLITILLGTNDLKKRFSVSAYDVAASAGVLIDVVQKSAAGIGGRAPEILLMAPPPFARLSEFAEMFEGGLRNPENSPSTINASPSSSSVISWTRDKSSYRAIWMGFTLRRTSTASWARQWLLECGKSSSELFVVAALAAQ